MNERSYKRITDRDLARLAEIAAADREAFIDAHPRYAPLSRRVVCVALCQGAALHFVDGRNGIKDFDVWTFYARTPRAVFPPRRRVTRDFGFPKFGQSPDWHHFVGRRVDMLGRSVNATDTAKSIATIRRYFESGRTASARFLRQKAVVLLEPSRSEEPSSGHRRGVRKHPATPMAGGRRRYLWNHFCRPIIPLHVMGAITAGAPRAGPAERLDRLNQNPPGRRMFPLPRLLPVCKQIAGYREGPASRQLLVIHDEVFERAQGVCGGGLVHGTQQLTSTGAPGLVHRNSRVQYVATASGMDAYGSAGIRNAHRLRRQLEGAEPRGVVVNVGGEDQLVGSRGLEDC